MAWRGESKRHSAVQKKASRFSSKIKPNGATCKYCGENMREVSTCSDAMVMIDGKIFVREVYQADYARHCPDCGVQDLGIHHFGCDNEMCPKCGDQFAFCACNKNFKFKGQM